MNSRLARVLLCVALMVGALGIVATSSGCDEAYGYRNTCDGNVYCDPGQTIILNGESSLYHNTWGFDFFGWFR